MINKNTAGVADDTDYGSSDPTNVGYQANGWYKLSTHPLYFTRAGHLWSADYNDTTTSLLYWSATSYSSSSAYSLSAYSGVLYPAGRDDRGYGFSVRCVTPSFLPPAQTLAALPILSTLLMAIHSLILILTTLSVPAACVALRLAALLSAPTTGLVLLFLLRRFTTCSSILVAYGRRTATTAAAEGPSAAWQQLTTNLLWYIIKLGTTRSNS